MTFPHEEAEPRAKADLERSAEEACARGPEPFYTARETKIKKSSALGQALCIPSQASPPTRTETAPASWSVSTQS